MTFHSDAARVKDDLDRLISNVIVAARATGFARGRGRPAEADDKAEDGAVDALRDALGLSEVNSHPG